MEVSVNANTYATIDNNTATAVLFTLKAGVPNINVVDVERTFYSEESCSDGTTSSGTAVADYKQGVVTVTGTENGQTLSCTYKFTPAGLPTTVASGLDILNLETWGMDEESPGFIETTCPGGDDVQPDDVKCDGYGMINFTFIDDQGGRHNASSKGTFKLR